MNRNRYSEEKITSILKEHEAGTSVRDLSRRHGIAENTIYRWKSKFGGMGVPEATSAQLREMASHLREASQLTRGFAAGVSGGPHTAALFVGGNRAGKTMAAEVLARELGAALHRVDLAALASKYIGETEKNLARVLKAAEDSGAVLLFDEADALFGKRGEVKDSHDRYANLDVNYLLQRIEAFRGVAILSTNRKAAIDDAFLRRLRFVIEFPKPKAGEG